MYKSIADFYQHIQVYLEKYKNYAIVQFVTPVFQACSVNTELSELACMTRLTILLESFYQSLERDLELKKDMLNIRKQRWDSHFGTPTLQFLITYKNIIDLIRVQFERNKNSLNDPFVIDWENYSKTHDIDESNQVYVDKNSIANVPMPNEEEKLGSLLKTYNPSGGFTTTPCDSYSKNFIEYASQISKNGGKVLEIGAGFGAASLQAIAQGATVFCNDIEPKNLAVVSNRNSKKTPITDVTEDDKKLIFIPGVFPDDLKGLPKNYFDAILICRVLHFFPGKLIEECLVEMADLLKEGGKLFIVCDTPYMKNWEHFLPEYKRRVAANVEWPGEITNVLDYESSGRTHAMPVFGHRISKNILNRSILRTNLFNIEQSSYIDRRGQFPEDLLSTGKESVGAIAIKKFTK